MTSLPNKHTDRWLLPEGIGEVLPEQAQYIESLRRALLDLYQSWGYELVIPPLMEFTESLLINANHDVDLQTFKVIDQISGRTMGIRADITPQAARIDAHALNRNGPVRLCYAGSVLHTRPSNALVSRSPIQIGAEYFGSRSLQADIEIISLMLASIKQAQIPHCCLSLGHVGIFRALTSQAQLSADQANTLLEILQRKATNEAQSFLQQHQLQDSLLAKLPRLNGDGISLLDKARQYLNESPSEVLAALDELETITQSIKQRYPDTNIHFDLAELPGFHYHTGVVFAAYAEGAGAAIANGGRYDSVGEVFGRARPATGFNTDLKTLIRLGQTHTDSRQIIVACLDNTPEQWQFINTLRQQGERVVCVVSNEEYDTEQLQCNRQVIKTEQGYQVQPL